MTQFNFLIGNEPFLCKKGIFYKKEAHNYEKKYFCSGLSVASLSAGVVFSVGPDSGDLDTRLFFILDSGNSVSINRSTVTPKVSGKYADGSVINSGYSSVSNTQIEAKWDYNGTMLGISTGSPYLIDLT